ncbi:mechanosensitive ion channel family protein [Paracidovorax sp. MALMAid1276]|uniref:mechanosensitive ion channel family protein n=1 Tax=Paracidovorax sp. MALMAid1276 TaxID=3411631 RepID=UPI003B99B659
MTPSPFITWIQETTLAGIPLWSLLIAATATVATYAVILLALRVATGRAKAWSAQSDSGMAASVVDVLEGTSRFLMLVVALLVGAAMLDLPGRWEARISQLWFVAVALQMGLWGMRAIGIGVQRYLARHNASGMTQVGASATLMSWGLRTLLWSVILLAVLSNLGVNITAFIASLGVGGIAVALAVQNILGDLFASLAIAVDKPFQVGDFVVVGGVAGTVQMIGLKTTRIRSLQGEEVVMSNTDLLKQTINNYRPMQERRIVFAFGVTYDTPIEKVEAIPGVVRKLIESHEQLRFDRAHFKSFGDSSLDYEVVYIVKDPAYGVYMDMQQSINLGLMREFAAMNVEFAFPTRTVHVASLPALAQGADGMAPARPMPVAGTAADAAPARAGT